MHIVVYRSTNPEVLWGRFGLFVNARRFVDLLNADVPAEFRDFVAFDTKEWEVVWSDTKACVLAERRAAAEEA